jgi:hypothetical protein
VIVVYTTILGGSDSLKPAPTGADRCVCFVDDVSAYTDAMGWELRPYVLNGADPRRTAWNVRSYAHALFPEATRTVWIDASFTLTDFPRLLNDAGDAPLAALRHHARQTAYQEAVELVKCGQATKAEIDAQVKAYRSEGYPGFPLSISCVIVRANTPAVQKFNETWDAEIRKWPGDNTQVSLDYSAWKNGLTITALQGKRKDNPYATHDHADHKKRRRPYRQAVTA